MPVRWRELSDTGWLMALRCGACGVRRTLVLDDEAASNYSAALDRGLDEITAELLRLDRERMRAQADAFAFALARDLIDAADFAR